MNPQFRPLTRHEMFFGIAPNKNLSTGGTINSTEMISKAAATPVDKPYIPSTSDFPINTDAIAKQQIGFVLTNFLWKYRWEIGLGVVVGIIIYRSINDNKDKRD